MVTPFVGDLDERITPMQLEEQAAKGAAALVALGLGEDVPVAVILRNDLAHLEVMRAGALAGTILVPINWHAAADEVAAICEDSGADTVIMHSDLVEPLKAALDGRRVISVTPGASMRTAYNLNDGADASEDKWSELVNAQTPIAERKSMRPLLRYTSGSTGRPKGVRRRKAGPSGDFEDVLRRVASDMMGLKPGSRYMTAAPLYHSAPSTLTSAALVAEGVSTLVLPRFEPEAFLAAIEREAITHIYLVPTMMSRLLKLPEAVREKYDVSSVEFCVSTGSPWPHDLKLAMIEWWGPVFWESYGATEIGFMTMVSSQEALERPGTAGRMQMGATAMILDPDGNELPAGAVGEIHVRMEAFGGFDYSNDPQSRADAEKHGHCSVGDLGWVDEDGYLFISDRKKDMIISGGANIFPAEIEAVLMAAPFIRDAAVFGAPDVEFGEKVVAAIEPADGWTADDAEVRAFLEGRLARFKHPRIIDFHEALPREDTGKIFKPRLREPYWKGAGRRI